MILITGATGFVGSHCLNTFMSRGERVIALRRNNKEPRIQLDNSPIWLNKDIGSVEEKDLKGVELVLHLAAHSTNVPYDNREMCIKYNIQDTIKFLETAQKSGVKRYIVAGSCFEYGKSGDLFTNIPTTAPLVPTNVYAASKAASYIIIKQWAEEYQLTLSYIRIFQCYGDGESETRLWPTLRRKAQAGEDVDLTDGNQIRDIVKVETVAKIFHEESMRILKGKRKGVNTYNIASNHPTTIKDFATKEWKNLNGSGSLNFGALKNRDNEIMRYCPGEESLFTEEK